MAVHYLTVNPGALADTGTSLSMAFRASSNYGGVTITAAKAVADSAGTLALYLVNYGTSGTVVGGTIAGNADGTAKVWTADGPVDLAITAANAFVDSGEYVFVKKVESAAANDTGANCAICIEYVDGVVSQG